MNTCVRVLMQRQIKWMKYLFCYAVFMLDWLEFLFNWETYYKDVYAVMKWENCVQLL